jgi:hypothetical protein
MDVIVIACENTDREASRKGAKKYWQEGHNTLIQHPASNIQHPTPRTQLFCLVV